MAMQDIFVSRKSHIKVIKTQFKGADSGPWALCLTPLISSKCCIKLTSGGVLIDV